MDIGPILLHWYKSNARELPWRQTKDPYHIWVSEIIMQQTRIDQGLPYYIKFIDKFPTVKDLATAKQDDVLLLWQGLGYYSRARNMHETAKFIHNELKGNFPKSANELIKLKGIGKYTAAAISSFCFNENLAAIDGNVIRVIARLFNIKNPVNKNNTAKQIDEISNKIVKHVNANDYNQAVMDFGATVCTPNNPKCTACPLQIKCEAFISNTISLIPFKEKKTKIRKRFFIYIILQSKNQVLTKKRTGNDIWEGLHEFILIEMHENLNQHELLAHEKIARIINTANNATINFLSAKPHKLSHQTLYAQFIHLQCNKLPTINGYSPININHLNNIALPTLIKNYIPNIFST